jgi:hypothetical protein
MPRIRAASGVAKGLLQGLGDHLGLHCGEGAALIGFGLHGRALAA